MAKRSLRTLYELMETEGEPTPRAHPEPAAAPPDAPAPGTLFSGSRVLRIPAGWLLLAIAGVLLAIVFVYMIGHRRGEIAAQARFDERLLGAGIDPARIPRDPLTVPEDRIELPPAGTGPGGFGAAGPGEAGGAINDEPRPDPDGGPVESDPRQPGLHYLVLAETRPDGAVRLATFLRSEGLDAYVVSSHNARLRRVIVTPGFESPLRGRPEARVVIERVERVGRLWKQEHRGASDLSDMYMLRYDG